MVWRSLFIAQGRNNQGNSCYCSFRRFMTLLLLRTRQAATLKGQCRGMEFFTSYLAEYVKVKERTEETLCTLFMSQMVSR